MGNGEWEEGEWGVKQSSANGHTLDVVSRLVSIEIDGFRPATIDQRLTTPSAPTIQSGSSASGYATSSLMALVTKPISQ